MIVLRGTVLQSMRGALLYTCRIRIIFLTASGSYLTRICFILVGAVHGFLLELPCLVDCMAS